MSRVTNSFASTKTAKKTESSIISSAIKNNIPEDYYYINNIKHNYKNKILYTYRVERVLQVPIKTKT